jgi:hypothetical protein
MFGRTMQDYYSSCSFGKAAFTEPNNVVVGTVTLPCNGTGPLGAWDARLCRNQVIGRKEVQAISTSQQASSSAPGSTMPNPKPSTLLPTLLAGAVCLDAGCHEPGCL